MPSRKKTALTKTKLKPEQEEQIAAIKEIEEFLATEKSETLPIGRLEIRNQKSEIRNNLNTNKIEKVAQFNQKKIKNIARQEIENKHSKSIDNKTKFLSVHQQTEARSPYLVNLKNILEARERDEAKKIGENLKKLPNFVKKLPANRKEVMHTIVNYSQSSVTSTGIFWQGVASAKNTFIAGNTFLTDFYRKRRSVLDEILIFNILMLVGCSIWRAGKYAYIAFAAAFNFISRAAVKGFKIIRQSKAVQAPKRAVNFIIAGVFSWFKFLKNNIKREFKAIGIAKHQFKNGTHMAVHSAQGAVHNLNQNLNQEKRKLTGRLADFFKKFLQPLKFLPPLSWQRQLFAFAAVVIMVIAPLKVFGYLDVFQTVRGKVLGESEEAAGNLQAALSAGGQLNFSGAASRFSSAADNFSEAQAQLAQYSNLISVAHILPSKKTKLAAAGQTLISSGQEAAKIGEYLSLGFDSLQIGKTNGGSPLTERINSFTKFCRLALSEMEKFEQEINSLDIKSLSALEMDGKEPIIKQLGELQTKIGLIKTGLSELTALSEVLPVFLGEKIDKRYLLIFQNNAEMRASGGFIGSFALIDFRRGEIKNLEVPGGGSYDLQGGLHKRVASPAPLHLINSLWEFQDSNWWPDWPTSAKKIAWFFENGWGSTVDGVIAIDPTFFEAMLKIIGPVDLTREYGSVINADNFYDIVQAQAERKDTNKSKTIIRDLMNKIVAEFPARLTADNFLTLLKTAEESIAEKHVLLQFNDPALREFINEKGWSGEIKNTERDYVAVINTNIAGGKSDRKIKQTIEHLAEVTPDGTITDTLTITREHSGVKREPFSGVRNVDYLRVYVPQGSELLETSGWSAPDQIYFDPPAEGAEVDADVFAVEDTAKIDESSGLKIYREFKKTVFAGWTQVDPGQTITVKLKYKLPFKLNNIKTSSAGNGNDFIPYSLLAQKQAGSITSDFSSILKLPASLEIVWSSEPQAVSNNNWRIKSDLRRDEFWGGLIKHK
ncbi:MAG: DUF4012 domain-containing protein [Patescibacteria group bacterium]